MTLGEVGRPVDGFDKPFVFQDLTVRSPMQKTHRRHAEIAIVEKQMRA
jgi:hypothetical protein